MSRYIHYIFGILVMFQLCHPAHAALSNSTVIEVRSGATAASVNGGAFNPSNSSPGTDYSQQNSAQYTATDLASSNGSTAPCTVTSASHSFVSADQGNIIHINSGTNWTSGNQNGFYEIVSVSGGAATLDRACGSVASLTGGTYHVGGALSMSDSTDGQVFIAFTGPMTWWIKNGTYTMGANWNVQGAGSVSAYGYIRGYNSSRGDNPTGTNRPLIKLNGNLFLTPQYWDVENIQTIGASTNDTYGALGVVGGNSRVVNVRAVNTSTASSHFAAQFSTYTQVINSEFVSYNGIGVNFGSNQSLQLINCYFHDSAIGVYDNYSGSSVNIQLIGNTFSGLTDSAIKIGNSTAGSGNYLIFNNTFYGGESKKIGTGINLTGTSMSYATIMNNIFYGLSTAISVAASQTPNIENYNTFNNNTTNRTNISTGSNSITTNPNFVSVGQYTGTTATSSGTTLTDSGANFANVVANRDFLYVSASTGGNTGVFGITGSTSTTITTDNSLGSGSSITYSIIYGQNWGTNSAMTGVGYQVTGNPNTSTYFSLGSAQPQYTDPGIANVNSATTYTYANTSETGTLSLPTQSQVLNGVSYGIGGNGSTGNVVLPTAGQVQTGVTFGASSGTTGTYTGSDRWSDPGVNNVLNGVAYQANSLTNNRTGNYVGPSTGNVKTGITYGSNSGLTGTYDGSDRWTDPGVNNVLNGVAYKANSTSNNETGNVVLPTAGQVQTGVTFGSNSGTTGTYTGSDRWSDPGQDNVRNGTAYQANSLSNNKTGDLVVPVANQVKHGVTFESSGGTTGTYTGSDLWSDPGSTNVKIGVQYQANSATNNETGTYDGSDRWTDPGVNNVLTSVTYKANSLTTNRTGNVVLPTTSQVQNGVTFGSNSSMTGTLLAGGENILQSSANLTTSQSSPFYGAVVFSQGDAAVLRLRAVDSFGLPVSLSGATFQTQIRGPQGVLVTIGNSAHTADPDQVGSIGWFTLNLSTSNTSACDIGPGKDIVTTVTISSMPLAFHGDGILTVKPGFPIR